MMGADAATGFRAGRRRRLWLHAVTALVFGFLVLPCLLVIPMSFSDSRYLAFPPEVWSLRWYRSYFGSQQWLDATWLSVEVAVLATAIATPIGTAAAYGIQRLTAGVAAWLRITFLLPMIVPHIFLAIGVFFVFARLGLNNSLTGLVLAHTMLVLPFVFITVTSGLQQVDPSLELAARNLGASRLVAFVTVLVPQLRLSIAAGALFSFITSFDEVLIALFISSGRSSTLPRRMFANIRDQVDPTVAAVSSLLILLSVVILIGAQFVKRPSGASR